LSQTFAQFFETKTKIQMNSYSNLLPNLGDDLSLEFPTFKKWLTSAHDHVIPHERNNYHPHLLSHRMLALVSILVISLKIASISVVAFGPTSLSLAAPITSDNIVSLANEARVENGLGELKTSSLLAKAAQNKANDMLARQYFAHNTPDGQTPWSFIKAVGYAYTTAGENLAIDFTQAENIQAAWMNSPGHRANIVNGSFTEIGIGIASGMYNGHQTTIVVQMFGNPLNAPVTLQEKPTQVAPAPAAAPAPAPAAPAPVASVPAQPAPAPVATLPEPTPTTSLQNAVPSAPTTEAVPVGTESLQVIDTKTSLQGDNLYLEVTASENVVKLLAFYGAHSLILDPIGVGLWKGTIPLANFSPQDKLTIQAQDMAGKMHQEPVAQFSGQLTGGEVEGAQITLFGNNINLKVWEEKTFLLILAALLTVLVLAIAIKRHVQHLSLVANTSFVAMLIAMMLMI
jgi:hypothetical protein